MTAIKKLKALILLSLITCSLCENISSYSSMNSSYGRNKKNSSGTSYKRSMSAKLIKIEQLSKHSFNVLSHSKDLSETLTNIDNGLEKLKEIKSVFDDSHQEQKFMMMKTLKKRHISH